MLHFNLSPGLLALGVIEGMTYGILAVGLVLVYRTSKVINFAHGEIGAIGAAACGVAVVRWHLPYWMAFVLALSISAALGAGTEAVVVRRLTKAPKLMSLVATLGVASFLLSMSTVINNQVSAGTSFPLPAGMPQFHIGVFFVSRAYSAMLILSPIIVLTLVAFLRYSRFGLALRAASANPERARLAGVSATRMSTMAWAIAGAVAAYTVVLILPTQGFITADVFGPTLLLRALVPCVIARMRSMPVALGAGIAIGLVDQILIFHYPTSGISEVFLLGIVVIALLVQSPRTGRRSEREDWSALQPWGPLPAAFEKVWAIRNLGRIVAGLGLAVAVTIALQGSNSTAVTMVSIVAFSLIGLSIGVVTGLGGQVSLGQFALAGAGATASYLVTYHTGNFLLSLLASAATGAALSLILGIPALRVRGLLLAVITLSFAVASERYLLAQSWALGNGVDAGRPVIAGMSLALSKRYFLYSLVVFAVGLWLARNVWRGGIGLRLRAQRDNEDATRAFALSTTVIKQQGFLVGGVLAGLGGDLYGHLLNSITAPGFDVVTSINVVALAVLGGVGVLSGPVLGALYIIGLPRFLPLDNAELAATSLGWLVLILYFPGGVAQAVAGPRHRLIDWLARRSGLDPVEVRAGTSRDQEQFATTTVRLRERHQSPRSEAATTPLLEVSGLAKRYGGISAVRGVTLELQQREILGVLGPNGAGKTTLFELIGGFTSADSGQVVFAGEDVSRFSPQRRADRGLIRSFQDPALFATLTVTETIALAFERSDPTRFVPSAVGLHRSERRRMAAARDLVELMGLQPFALKEIRALSTGTRRIAELACVVALEPKVLLLDEPSSGIAQRESEALAGVLIGLREYLDASFMIIEHDIPLLMSLSDRVVAMDSGQVIAEGLPGDVQANPLVLNSYLGGDIAAIGRSGSGLAARRSGICGATTRGGSPCKRKSGPDGFCPTHSRVGSAR